MFAREKDMIPVLREKLASVFETDHFSEEFRSGNGVVDLVFTTSINKEWLWKNPVDFETVYYLSNHINALNKKIPFDFLERTSMQKQKRVALLRVFLQFQTITYIVWINCRHRLVAGKGSGHPG